MSHCFCSSVDSSCLFVHDAAGGYRPAAVEEVLQAAHRLLASRIAGQAMTSPELVREFLSLKLGSLQHEVFAVLWLDAQHCVIEYSELFRGTLMQTAVYPREIVREALARNAASVVLVHNHPSGTCEPSRADEQLTQTLKAALALVDVKVLDHMIVGGARIRSLAESGLL